LKETLVKLSSGEANMRTKTAIISVENLKSSDFPALRQALLAVPGVDSVDFSLERSVTVIEFDPSQSHLDDFLRAVLKAGFKVF
jgi:copper chaperone CopZ